MNPRAARALALAGLAVSVGMGTCSLAEGARDEVVALATASLGLELFIGLAALAAAALSQLPLKARLGLGPGRLPGRSLALLVVGTLALSHGLDGILEISGLREHSALAEFDALLAGASGAALGLALLAIGLAPGIAEELLCRGLIQRGLESRLGAAPAIVLAALCFGALHIEPIHAAFAAVLGLYLGTVAWLTGSVRAPMLCHAVNNLSAVALVAHFPEAEPHSLPGTVIACGVAIACLVRVGHGNPPPAREAGHRAAEGPQNPTAEP